MSRFDSRSNLTKLDSLEYLAGSRKYNVYLRPSYACDRRNETDGGWKRWDGFSGSFVRRPTLHVAYLRNTGGHARRHRSLRTHLEPILTSNRIGSTLDFPYSRWNFASRSLFLSLPLSPLEEATCRRDPRVGVRRRRISRVETSSSPLCRDDGDPETWITVAGGPGRAE